ncbi:MAG TPA: hypothetical protein VEG37_09420 [Burkholderiales bacterium]|nr:hypothetical protein [Burkholderiales bacterium]
MDKLAWVAFSILVLGALFLAGLFLFMRRDLQQGDTFREFLLEKNRMFEFGRRLFGIETKWLLLGVPNVLIVFSVVLVDWLFFHKVCVG